MTYGRSAARDLEEADSDTDSGSNDDIGLGLSEYLQQVNGVQIGAN
jgi:hypothetical protein